MPSLGLGLGLHKQIIQMSFPIYGVEVDFVNRTFTRLAGAVGKTPGTDFDSILAFGGRRRCNLADDGTVNAYFGDAGYIEDGSNGQVMVEQPKFYYKVVPLQLEPITDGIGYHLRKARYYVSDTPKVGFKVHPAFIRNGVVKDKIYLSAYEGSIYDESAGTYLLNDEQVADFDNDKLSSIAGAKPCSGLTQSLSRANTRKLAENRGTGWQQKDVLCASASQMLMMIEYASCCSGTSRKTRIETLLEKLSKENIPKVAVELPEKQGLKLSEYKPFASWVSCCSGTSRKTRIETN